MIILDTTVLVCAVGTEHPLRGPCRALVEAIERGDLTATTSVEVIQEFTHVRARRRSRADAVALAKAYIDLLSPLLVVEEDDLQAGLRLFETVAAVGAFDAVLAAAALAIGAEALVSADAGYGAVGGLRHVVPDLRGVSTLLPAADSKDS